ncbi:putative integral membrane protein [Actinacidiphila reveromycinica]|uniref:Putative integral membrane protein n=1 Tax=Actinacidiphila reveromycinica TaxID=659352 RepID=A0A7U3VQH1_9ACTN|nr:ABC transporter permease [Streptomyces sp. SN-593]BBA99785.1 putative integral membrane protein [Streptomyces sp. SN-593]
MSSGQAPPRSEPFAGFDAAGGGPPRPGPGERSADLRTWLRDLALGARFAVGGGREGWTRTLLTAVGVGLGVTLLLLTASVPAMVHTHSGKEHARESASEGYIAHPGDRTLLWADAGTTYHDHDITGYLLHPEGKQAQLPPGLESWPADGTMVVSPALRELLASAPLLRQRLDHKVTGTIGKAGLVGPADLYFYAGSDHLVARDAQYRHGNADRISGFGSPDRSDALGAPLEMLLIVVLVVLLLPVAVFIGTAVRLGGERRDRRLAALRLVGADIRMARRIAAGEALLGALFGLALGTVLFLAGRQLAAEVSVMSMSAFPSDLAPNPALTVLIVLAVPLASIAVTLAGLRGTAIEPLGVVRQALGRRRRLWWRLLPPAAGLALLAPLFGKVHNGSGINEYQVAAGAVLLLIGVTAVLPWAVEAAVGRLRGGPVAWQLATRRLQLSSSASARMVSGVTVAVAGAIALQMLFNGVSGDYVHSTGADTRRAQAVVDGTMADTARLAADARAIAAAPGVRQVYGYGRVEATRPDAGSLPRRADTQYPDLPLDVGDCTALRQMARITSCRPGSVFLVPPTDDAYGAADYRKYLRPGARIDLNGPDGDTYTGSPRLWRIPAAAVGVRSRADATGSHAWGVLATPQAVAGASLGELDGWLSVVLDPDRTDAIEHARNAVAALGPDLDVFTLYDTRTKAGFVQIRRGLFAGAAFTMALIGAGLLVTMLEQLRERRKLLAVLVAFGTRRSVLGWSVLWQTAVPVVLGLLLAVAGGIGLGAALLAMVRRPFHTDWAGVGTMAGVGAGVVLAVTLLSLPPLWRLMRADGLRTE